ncbi:MAG TPA: ATP-binding protein [Ktedonobacterales bacterium]|nr:ATP-binding protein [Ktedonobacterales bacterium]
MTTNEPINILMVDDQPGKLLSYEAILDDLGEHLIKATSGREALEQLLKHEIAIVLMDVSMPEIDGFELAEIIRQHPRYQKTAIIFVSAVRLTDLDRLKGYESGAVDYIPVPVIPEILRAKVSVFADLYRKSRELEALNHQLEQRVEERTAEVRANADRLRDSEERFRVIMQNTSAVIYLIDAAGRCLQVNRGFERVFGVADGDARGQSIYDLLPPETSAVWKVSHQRVITERASVEFEEEIASPIGIRTYTSIKTPLFDSAGRPSGIVNVSTDITERKQAENERAELLQREHDARLAAEDAIQVRDDFLSVAAHELKTPVTSLRATAQIIARKLQKSGQSAPQWLTDGLRVIDQQSERLTRLIGQLLDISRLDRKARPGERISTDIVAMAERLVAVFRARSSRHTLTLSGDVSALADIDPVGVEQILSNLIDNAIKYSPDGGQIDVEVYADAHEQVRISVRDRGIGIPPEKRGEIFNRFYQAHADEHRSGLGLGLFISHQIVEQHGGMIAAEFPPDGGTRFIVTLPVHAITFASATSTSSG